MAIWQKTFYIEINRSIRIHDISPTLDKLFERDWSTETLQCWGRSDTNDLLVTWDKESSEINEDITFRVDLRELNIAFIEKVINFARDLGLKFRADNINTFDPELSEIAQILADSNAEKFTTNPRKFLDDLQNGIIKPE